MRRASQRRHIDNAKLFFSVNVVYEMRWVERDYEGGLPAPPTYTVFSAASVSRPD